MSLSLTQAEQELLLKLAHKINSRKRKAEDEEPEYDEADEADEADDDPDEFE